MTFQQRLEGGEGASHVYDWAKGVPGRGNSVCKGHEAGECWDQGTARRLMAFPSCGRHPEVLFTVWFPSIS